MNQGEEIFIIYNNYFVFGDQLRPIEQTTAKQSRKPSSFSTNKGRVWVANH